MGARDRLTQLRYERLLRPMTVGRWTHVLGRPKIDATDAVAGDTFRIHSIEATTLLRGPGKLRIGDDVYLNSGVRIESWEAITIGDHVLIAFGAVIFDSDMHGIGQEPVRQQPVVIGSGSWIGAHAIVLPGVTIGRRSIVGAGSVVTRDVPDATVVAGNPARVLRELDLAAGQRAAFA